MSKSVIRRIKAQKGDSQYQKKFEFEQGYEEFLMRKYSVDLYRNCEDYEKTCNDKYRFVTIDNPSLWFSMISNEGLITLDRYDKDITPRKTELGRYKHTRLLLKPNVGIIDIWRVGE